MAGARKNIPAATQAALWALSNGRCYAPHCPCPVVMEVRPGIYRKNSQMGHIYGVKRGAARFTEEIPDEERDAFSNLLLLCLPHHADVDDKETGERIYPPDRLREWKAKREGSDAAALAVLGRVDEDGIGELLAEAFTPPIERLQAIADQLEQTGTLNAATVLELRQVVRVLADAPSGLDARAALLMHEAADTFGTSSFTQAAAQLSFAADALNSSVLTTMDRKLAALDDAVGRIDEKVKALLGAADSIDAMSRTRRNDSW